MKAAARPKINSDQQHMDGWMDGMLISLGSVPNCNMLADHRRRNGPVGVCGRPELLKSETTHDTPANGIAFLLGQMR